MTDDPASDVLAQAAEALAGLAAPLTAAAQAQQAAAAAQQVAAQQPRTAQQQAQAAAQPPLPLTQPGYVYGPQTPQQQAAQQAQQSGYPSGGVPAWRQPQAQPAQPMQPPAPTPQQQAQQQAAAPVPPAGPSPGTLALAAARAAPLGGAQAGPGLLDYFERGVSLAGRGLSALSVAAGAATAALGTLGAMGAAASPTHAATLAGSAELFAARMGAVVLPAMEEASRLLQNAARNLPDIHERQAGLGGFSIQDVMRFSARVSAAVVTQGGSERDRRDPLLSYAAMPQPQIGTADSYYNRLTTQALGQGPLEQELLREQLQNLQDSKLLLQRIADSSSPPVGSFR